MNSETLVRNTDIINLPGSNLNAALVDFFTQLVAAQAIALPNSIRNMRIDVSYCWQVIDSNSTLDSTPPSAQMPLLLLPLYEFNVSTDTSGSFIDLLADTIAVNATNAGIASDASGQYLFEVTLYNTATSSDQSDAPQPLVEISRACYPRAGYEAIR